MDGDPMTLGIVTGPAHGVLSPFNADGSFTYTPNSGYSGTDSFQYKANDGILDSNIATVNLDVQSTLPTLSFNGQWPALEPDGTYVDSIGGNVSAQLTAAPAFQLESVTWTVDGAVQYQASTSDSGLVDVPLASPTLQGNLNGAYSTVLGFFWNGVPGIHVVQAAAVYSGGFVAPLANAVVNIQAPTVTEFKRVFQPLYFGVDKVPNAPNPGTTDAMALMQQTRNPDGTGKAVGDIFTAKVSTQPDAKNRGGEFAFLQLAQVNDSLTLHKSGPHQRTSPAGKWFIDSPRPPMPQMWVSLMGIDATGQRGWISKHFAANVQNIQLPQDGLTPAVQGTKGFPDLPANSPAFINDSPLLQFPPAAYNQGDYLDKMVINRTYKTQLLFAPDDLSDWYVIASLTWTLNGTAVFNGPGDGTLGFYENTANWTVTGPGQGNIPSPTPQDATQPQVVNGTTIQQVKYDGWLKGDVLFNPPIST